MVRDEWPREYPLDLKSMDYFDLAAIWDMTDSLTLRLGVNNVLDEDPPLWTYGGAGIANGNTYPGHYDALGRYWFTGISIRL